ncbi:MAG: transcriptional repressor [Oscillospiraceae bacterium]|nr:transcriptional repressor [Oscillospiraceae bacterium]
MTTSRNTVQRVLVYRAVQETPTHPTADEIFTVVHTKNPRVSRATVYRNLSVLSQKGEIRQIQIPAGADRYDFNCTPHYHFHCRQCDCVFDMEMPVLPELETRVGMPGEFDVQGYELVFTGVCPDCK